MITFKKLLENTKNKNKEIDNPHIIAKDVVVDFLKTDEGKKTYEEIHTDSEKEED